MRDAQLKADLMQFIKECTLYDIRDGYVTPDDIMTGTAVWNKIFTDTNPARFVSYNTLSSSILTASCKDVAPLLQDRINTAVTAGNTFYGGQVFTRAQTDAIATGMFVATVGTSYGWILNSTQNASDAMKQSMFNNLWREAGTELPALLGDAATDNARPAFTRQLQIGCIGGRSAKPLLFSQSCQCHDARNVCLMLIGQRGRGRCGKRHKK